VNREACWLMLSLRGVRLGSARLMQLLGVRLGSRTTYAAPKGFPSKSQLNTRTQTEGPSPYWYSLSTTRRQADTMSTCHGSAGTPLGTHANGEALGPEEACSTLRT
jgi:hypothetical protein